VCVLGLTYCGFSVCTREREKGREREREREKGRERIREREKGRERVRERVCVF